MPRATEIGEAIAGKVVGVTTTAMATGAAKLTVALREEIAGMPRDERQEVRILLARLDPGDRTPYHSHRFPVAVYVLGGAFTLELDGHEPVTISAGETFVEPPHVRMTGHNRSTSEATCMVIFYVSDPGTPFADPAR